MNNTTSSQEPRSPERKFGKQTFGNDFDISKCFPNDTNPPLAFGSFRKSFTAMRVARPSAVKVVNEATSPCSGVVDEATSPCD
ncbi:hypothetical protein Rcae01_04534 [Novipirellula caenicola]|uniref:Uncharacterized protein n=1 Tax=Novipirellula caenicola TaxID=1536901 RepID=A0ABP9VWV7_9BACT